MDNRPIGIMDSGIGGLTAVKELCRQLPNESFIYVGDNARLPYGPREVDEVARFVLEIGHFLEKKGAKLLLIACNTATVAGLYRAQKELSIPVIGMIQPGSQAAVKASKHHHYAVFATEGTVNSHAYKKAITEMDQQAKVTEIACPSFVTLVEQHHWNDSLAQLAVREAVTKIDDDFVDTLILGCTHFPILKECIEQEVTMNLVDPGKESISDVAEFLNTHQIQADKTPGKAMFYTTGNKEGFATFIDDWLKLSDYTLEELNERDLIYGYNK